MNLQPGDGPTTPDLARLCWIPLRPAPAMPTQVDSYEVTGQRHPDPVARGLPLGLIVLYKAVRDTAPQPHTEGGAMVSGANIDWFDRAACQGLGWKEFFDAEELTAGRQICIACPVRARCLQFAINNNITNGIWGGLSPLERRRARLPRTWVA